MDSTANSLLSKCWNLRGDRVAAESPLAIASRPGSLSKRDYISRLTYRRSVEAPIHGMKSTLAARRQEPISCSLCRKRKLRCNRQIPCSNCVARNVSCEREGSLPPPNRVQNRFTASSTAGNDVDIFARLERLESLILQTHGGRYEPNSPASTQLFQQATPQSVLSSYEAENAHEAAHKVDTKRLEDVGTKENLLLFGLTDGIHFEVMSIQEILVRDSPPQALRRTSARLIILPELSEALTLLDIYAEHVDYLHHVLLLTRVRSQIHDLYDCLPQSSCLQSISPALAPAALILAVLASAAASIAEVRTKSEDRILAVSPSLALMSASDARACSIEWMKATFDHLDYSRHMGSGCIEDVQAIVTVFFLIYNLEGFSARARTGFGHGLAIARDLGLHRIDHPTEKQDRSPAEAELARRVWCYISGTDWLLALSGGPQEGVYSVQPNHMQVNFPRNINDSDLLNAHTPLDHQEPLSIPTTMSYLIQRFNLAILCRKIVDAMPMSPSTPDTISYEQFIALDREFEKLFNELPPFFQTNSEVLNLPKKARIQAVKRRKTTKSITSSSGTPYLDKYADAVDPMHIATQRYMIHITAHTRRCKFHQPFLIRGFTDPKYRYSRDACLNSARAVLAIQQELEVEGLAAMGMFGLCGMNHHLFFATIALVMDLCFNKETGPDQNRKTEAKKIEIWRACKILEGSRGKSLVARRFLESLMDVLRKHRVTLIDEDGVESDMTEPEIVPSDTQLPEPPAFEAPNDFSIPQVSDFDAIWQTYIDYAPEDFSLDGWEDPFVSLGGL